MPWMRVVARVLLIAVSLAGLSAPSVHLAAGMALPPSFEAGQSSPLTASAIQPGSVNRSSMRMRATYTANATIAVSTGVIGVTTTIVARNDSGAGVDVLDLNTIAARLGAINSLWATVDGVPTTVTVSDQTLVVPLGGILPAGATAQVKVHYRATLKTGLVGTTRSNWLFTRYGGTLALYRWIPWISALRPFDRPNYGDPFVTPSSPHVHVDLSLDRAMIVATPAANLRTTAARSWSFGVDNVRDVSMVLAPDFSVTQATSDGVAIRAYSRPGGVSGAKLADLAVLALHREATRLGVAYPWPNFNVVETAGGYGMESPRLIWIPATTLSGNLTYLVHHETAHQWFYGLVGNDQQRQPFADEAAADLLARTVLGTLRASRCATNVLDRTILGYSSSCYYETIYIQGGDFLNLLRTKMGTTRFWQAMAGYVQANRFGLAGTRQMLDALRAASPVDFLSNLHARFPSLY
jgi:hypothetical protein